LAGGLPSVIWIAPKELLAGQSAVGLTARKCAQAGVPPARGSRESRLEKEIPMSTTVPTAWQINASLTLQGGSLPGCADAGQHHFQFCKDTLRKA
jgi:hypothetical protein